MAETEKKERAAPAKQAPPKAATLQQKFIELRKAIPAIVKGSTNEEHGYTFAKISDIYRLLVPAMNEHGVNFDIIEEKATKHDQNGDAKYITSYTQNTGRGERVVWVYEADLVIRWTNADNPKDCMDVTLHAIGTNDGGPDKAKGSAPGTRSSRSPATRHRSRAMTTRRRTSTTYRRNLWAGIDTNDQRTDRKRTKNKPPCNRSRCHA